MKASLVYAAVLALASALVSAQQPQAPPHPNTRHQPPFQAGQPSGAPQPPQTPPPNQNDAIQLRCESENGTVPHWLDKTCRSYLSCSNYTLSLQNCDDGFVYSWNERICVEADQVNCTEQNLQFAQIIRALLAPHFYQNIPIPKLPLVPFTSSSAASRAQFAARGPDDEDDDKDGGNDGGLTIDLDELPSIIVDNSNALNITLPAEMCQKLGGSVHQFEVSINTALLMLTGCPSERCDVPLFHLDC